MKKNRIKAAIPFTILCFLFLFEVGKRAHAQSPQAISYQAVARFTSGNTMANETISVLVTIHSGTATGTIVYSESHNTTTNQYGLFSLGIGNGTVISGVFSTIQWNLNPCFLEVGIDTSGGSSYTSLGTTQLLSVPYALYAERTAPPQLAYQVLQSNIPPTNVRNADILTADSIIVSVSGTYFISYEAYGNNDFSWVDFAADTDAAGFTFPFNATTGTAMMDPSYFTNLEHYVQGLSNVYYFTSNQTSKTKIEYLPAGTVIKGCGRINSTGNPTTDWTIYTITVSLLKIAP